MDEPSGNNFVTIFAWPKIPSGFCGVPEFAEEKNCVTLPARGAFDLEKALH
jgi:hypothetical protein